MARRSCASGATRPWPIRRPGGTASLVPELLGYEWDFVARQRFPASRPGRSVLDDPASFDQAARLRQHHRQRHGDPQYRRVPRPDQRRACLWAGTVFWSWGLSDHHDVYQARSSRSIPASSRRRSMCSPTWACSRRPCRRACSSPHQSTDHTAPTSKITSYLHLRRRRPDRHRDRDRHRYRRGRDRRRPGLG